VLLALPLGAWSRQDSDEESAVLGEKLLANRATDAAKREALESSGYDVMIVWECEIEEAVLEARLGDFWRGET